MTFGRLSGSYGTTFGQVGPIVEQPVTTYAIIHARPKALRPTASPFAVDTLPRYIAPGTLGNLGESSNDWASTLRDYAPAITAVTDQVLDPRRQVEVLRADLANAKARGASAAKIRKIEAKLRAAEQRLALKQESEADVSSWRTGVSRNLWLVSGIGAAAIVVLGTVAYANVRKSRRRR